MGVKSKIEPDEKKRGGWPPLGRNRKVGVEREEDPDPDPDSFLVTAEVDSDNREMEKEKLKQMEVERVNLKRKGSNFSKSLQRRGFFNGLKVPR